MKKKLPVITLFLLTTTLVSIPAVFAQFTTRATATDNMFSTAAVFPTPTSSITPTPSMRPTATPTQNPTITPTPTQSGPTPTPGNNNCGGDTNIDISGNGAGSHNSVDVSNTCSTTITQTNNTTVTNTVTSISSTGNNTSSFSTNGLTLVTGDAKSLVSIITKASSNSALIK